MNKYIVYKYVIDIREHVTSQELLELFSASRENGILKVKVVQGKNRVIVFALQNDFSFMKYGELIGEVEEIIFYEVSEYDSFEQSLRNELYTTDKEFVLDAWIEN